MTENSTETATDAAAGSGANDAERRPRPRAARVAHLTKHYGHGDAAVTALDDVTLNLYAGEFTAIMGPSGSGKSTLMHCAAGLDSVTAGTVTIGDVELTSLREKALTQVRRDRIGFIFQAFILIPTLTAEENILLPLAIAGRKPDQAWFDQVVTTVGLKDRLSHRPGELSGGQQQRVAVARALVGEPSILLADEPTGNLDSKNGEAVMALLDELHQAGSTICMVTHDPRYADFADRKVFMFDGRVVDEDTLHRLRQEEDARLDEQIAKARDRAGRDAVGAA